MPDASAASELRDALRPIAKEEAQGLDLPARDAFDLVDDAEQVAHGASKAVGGFECEFGHDHNIQDACTSMQFGCIVHDMELTKHTHATVVLSKHQASLVIDPGAYTPNSAELVAAASAVLVTHDHPDHFDAGILNAALDAQPELRVWGPASVVQSLGDHEGRVTAVTGGDAFEAAGFDVTVLGEHHAPIHPDVPLMDNVGYLVDGTVYHPGDSYLVPDAAVDLLLLPTSGPWAKLDAGVDFVRAVTPSRVIQVHDLMLSDTGRQSFAQFIGQLTGRTIETLEPGQSITV
jgi:L-ascorbate metabolism protein UlaG (beta-lactamase superfamily)